MPLGDYGYNPANYRPNFGFIAEAGKDIGTAVDAGVADYKQGQVDKTNQQLYSEIKAHAQALDKTNPNIRQQIGFTDETIRVPAKGESQAEYTKWATAYAHDLMTKAYEANLQQHLQETSKNLATQVGSIESGAINKTTQQAEQFGMVAGRQDAEANQTLANVPQFGLRTALPPPSTDFAHSTFTGPLPQGVPVTPQGQPYTNAQPQGVPVTPPAQSQSAFQKSTSDGVAPLDITQSSENAVQGLGVRPGLAMPQLSPQTSFDQTVAPENLPAGANQERPVSASKIADAATAQGVGEQPGIKEMESTREKDDITKTREALGLMGFTSREKIAGENIGSKEKIANQSNETKILIASMRDQYQKSMLDLRKRALGIQAMKNGEQKKTEYLKLKQGYQALLLKAQDDKKNLADPMKMGLPEADQKPFQDELDGMISEMTNDAAVLDETAKISDPAFRGASKKKAANAVDNFVVGKQYKDASGNVATYLGKGKWK
jgi:hypothetical protein